MIFGARDQRSLLLNMAISRGLDEVAQAVANRVSGGMPSMGYYFQAMNGRWNSGARPAPSRSDGGSGNSAE
jgi:hypothetical protein